jgi:hypothetical protein
VPFEAAQGTGDVARDRRFLCNNQRFAFHNKG